MSDSGMLILRRGTGDHALSPVTKRGTPISKIQNPKSLCRAFTLLEVLIAIALLLTLAGTMFGFLFDMLSSRARAQEYAARQRAASTLIDRLDGDLETCIVGDSEIGAGVQGDETHIRILTRAVLASAAELNVDDGEIFGDLQDVEYRFIADSQRIEARRSAVTHSNGSSAGSTFMALLDPRASMPMVRFRYNDGREWRSSYDSLEEGRLPVAVEVAVWFTNWPDALDGGTESAVDESTSAQSQPNSQIKNAAEAFDDDAWARRAGRDLSETPPPDRVRIILIPDSAASEDAGVEQ